MRRVLLGVVLFALWAHPEVPGPDTRDTFSRWGRRRDLSPLWYAARVRAIGAITFGLLHGVLFAFLALALVKFPIDIARGGRR